MTQPSSINFKELLLLSAPALIIGLIVRAFLIHAIPEGYFGADSTSYHEFSNDLLTEGIFNLSEKRRWLYPVFLLLADLLPFKSWYFVPFIQHLIGLGTILGIGWCSAQLANYPRVIVPPVTLLASIWPRMLWYEHEFMAESLMLAAFVAVIALLLTPQLAGRRNGLIFMMLAFALLAGMKGSVRFLWTGSVIGLFLIQGNPIRWSWSKISAFLSALSFFFVATIGKSSQGDWLALSSTLPLVRPAGEPYSNYRQELSAQILEARTYHEDYPWEVRSFKKRLNREDPGMIGPKWVELLDDKKSFSKVARSFWTEAIANHPIEFTAMTVKTIGIAASKPISSSKLYPINFWDNQYRISRRFSRKPQYFSSLFGRSPTEFAEHVQTRKKRKFLLSSFYEWIDKRLSWLGRQPNPTDGKNTKNNYPQITWQPLGILAIAGATLGLVFSNKKRQCLAILSPLVIYMVGTYAIGDAVARYLHPVDWIGFVFAGVFLDGIFGSSLHIGKSFKKA